MKAFLLTFCLIISFVSKADGIDRIHVYLNGEVIYQTELRKNASDYTIKAGDTLIFDAWTDWDVLDKSTLTFEGTDGDWELTLIQERNNQYGAQFVYIVLEEDLQKEFDIILNYNIREFAPAFFLSFNKGHFG